MAIYLDHNATTPIHPDILPILKKSLSVFGNPSSLHQVGQKAKDALETAREQMACFIGAMPQEISLTASATEANNQVLKSLLGTLPSHIITTPIEHPSILKMVKELIRKGAEVSFLPVLATGVVDWPEISSLVKPHTKLVSVMMANNETGILQPVQELGAWCRKNHIPFHTDASQVLGKMALDVSRLEVDFLTASGHKMYAPKGIGILYRKTSSAKMLPMLFGGEQERGLRAGTENVWAAIGLGAACKVLRPEILWGRLAALEQRFLAGIQSIPELLLNGEGAEKLAGTVNLSFLGVDGHALMMALDLQGIFVSTGSACSTGTVEPSHVLMAMNPDPVVAKSSVRFGFGLGNTAEQLDIVLDILEESVKKLRKLSPKKG